MIHECPICQETYTVDRCPVCGHEPPERDPIPLFRLTIAFWIFAAFAVCVLVVTITGILGT